MKQVLFIVIVSVLYAECTSTTTSNETASSAAVSSPESGISLPYAANYSSKFIPGKDSHVLAVLNWYKAWETGDMDAFAKSVADSITIYFSDGGVFRNTRDSARYYASKYRDSLANIKYEFHAWLASHSVDKDEDWVNVWYKEIDTYKNGKVDSAEYEEANMIDKNGKVSLVYSYKAGKK